MTDGWVKLQRNIMNQPFYTAPHILQVYIHILFNAAIKENTVEFNNCYVDLVPGQCIFGRKNWAFKLNMSEKKVYTAVQKLREAGLIEITSTNKYTVITVIDDIGQQKVQENGQQKDGKKDKPTLPSNSDISTDNEGRKIQEGQQKGQQKGQQTDSKRTHKEKDNKDYNINNIYTRAFETFWSKYPNPFNKVQTEKNFIKTAKSYGAETVLRALDNYLAEIEQRQTPKEYICRSTNFVGQKQYFLGYVDSESPKISGETPQESDNDKLSRLKAMGGFE